MRRIVHSHEPTPRSGQRDGFIVVAVLWLLAALATLAAIYSLYVRQSTATLASRDERLIGEALVQAGAEMAVQAVTATPGSRPSRGRVAFRLGKADVTATFSAENGRIDLNAAPRDVLANLFVGLGASLSDATYFAERIVAWRTPPVPGADDEETSLYRIAGKRYGPRRGLFQHRDELALVLGMAPDLIRRALPYLTVYSGRPEINVLAAPPAVLAALPGLTPARLQDLIVMREAAPQDVLRARLGTTARYVSVQPGNTMRLLVDVRRGGLRYARSEIVALVLDQDVKPYRILSRRDDIDEAAEEPQAVVR
jgi:general secretion pathway protein K